MKYNNKRIKYIIMALLELAIIIGIIILIPLGIYFKNPEIIENFKSMEAFDAFLAKYEKGAIPIYIICQILQVVITVIPGQAIQVAGGYIYGFILGMIFSLVGVFIGSFIAFGLARILGKRSMVLIFGEDRITRYREMLNTKRAHIILFVLYLIPGLPKDILAYAAGISDMDMVNFLKLSMAGRLLGMTVSVSIGAFIETQRYYMAIILAVVISIAFVISYIKRKTIIDYIEHSFAKKNIK